MNLSPATLQALEHSARAAFPNEVCGIIDNAGEWHELPNTAPAEAASSSFCIPAHDLALLAASVGVSAIVHTHTKATRGYHICTPSLEDVEGQEASNLPWLIAGFDGYVFTRPAELPPPLSQIYTGREYIYGLRDCGTLLRDWMYFEAGITFNVPIKYSLVPRSKWTESVHAVMLLNNMCKVDLSLPCQRGDVLLISVAGGRKNHIVIYLGDSLVLNQGVVSEVKPLSEYLSSIEEVWRHPTLGGIPCK